MSTMAHNLSTIASNSNYQSILDNALDEYRKKTGKDLRSDPLSSELELCGSPDAILSVFREHIPGFDQRQSGDDKSTGWLDATVNVLYAFSVTINSVSGGINVACPLAGVIFTGIGILLSAAQAARSNRDSLVDLFERIENFFRRLEAYTNVPPTPGMVDIIVKILVKVLSILSIATKEIKQSRAKKFLKKCFGRNDIENALQKLDTLTHDEARMASVQSLVAIKAVNNGVQDIGHKMDVIINGGADMRGAMGEQKGNQLQRELRMWLNPPDPSVNYNAARGVHHEGTAVWFTESDTFKDWKASKPLLWIHGKPGSGKSVLASAIIQDIEGILTGSGHMAYFFFDFKTAGKQDAHSLLSSFLIQLSDQSDSFRNILYDLYSTHNYGSQQPSDPALVKCLEDMLSIPTESPIYLILDALDECPNTTGISSPRDKVLALVARLIELNLPNLHVCVTSRPEIDIRTSLKPLTPVCTCLHDEIGQIKDIDLFVTAVVYSDNNMRKWRDEDKQLVIRALSSKADGMFRWVFCQLEILRHCLPASIQQVLPELPSTLDGTYERILREIPIANRTHAHRLLQCLAVAVRPLCVEELAEVLAVEFSSVEGIPKLNKKFRSQDQEQAVLSACSSLIAIVENEGHRVVQFSHFSVKEYLTSDRLAASMMDTSRFHHILFEPAHTIMAQACLGVLLDLDDHIDQESVSKYPLADYAARHFGDHSEFENVLSHILDGIDRLLDARRPHFTAWLWVRGSLSWGQSPGAAPLYYVAEFGFRSLVGHLISKFPQDLTTTGAYGMPLHVALREGHADVSQLLLGYCEDVNIRGADDQTPLHLAAYSGLLDVTRVLIRRGADINASDNEGRTPLRRALFWMFGRLDDDDRHLAVMKHLLECQADVDKTDRDQSTPLHLASYQGSVKAAQLLLEHKAKVDAQNSKDQTPLHLASESDDPETMGLLLKCGAGVDAQDQYASTPLHLVSFGGSLTAAQLLLKHGASVYLRNDEGQTPLHLAAQRGHPEMMQLLLGHVKDTDIRNYDQWSPMRPASCTEHPKAVQPPLGPCTSIDVRNNEGMTPLHTALETMRSTKSNGYWRIIQSLLQFGAEVDAQDNDQLTPLQLASRYGNVEGAQLLLEHRANVHVRNKGQTPLHQALESGFQFWGYYLELTQVLLDYDADVNAQNDDGSTPLHLACCQGFLEVAELLLKFGADIHKPDNVGLTPLHCASQYDRADVVRLLLMRDAGVCARDGTRSTPLHLASHKGSLAAVQLLLENGADARARDEEGGTPLHDACWGGYLEIMQLLLRQGADVDAQSNNGLRALDLALHKGDSDAVELLLEHGANIHL